MTGEGERKAERTPAKRGYNKVGLNTGKSTVKEEG